MRELTYYIATTLDGFIAHEDGSIDGFPSDEAYWAYLLETFPETFPPPLRSEQHRRLPNKRFDTVLMGRNTYDGGLKVGITQPYPTLQQYVFSHTMNARPDPAVTLVSANTVEVVQQLKQQDGAGIWLCGGAPLAAALLEANLIDAMIVKVNPVVFGSGIPLFAPTNKQVTLKLVEHKAFASGHIVLQYRLQYE